jgi:pilus assembly protein CpaB
MGRLRGYLWLVAGLVVAAVAGAVAFIALSRATADRADRADLIAPEQQVVIAAQEVAVRDFLTADDVEVIDMPVDVVPDGALTDVDQVIGKISLVALYPGEVVLDQRLLDPNVTTNSGRMALVVAEDEVLMAFPAGDLLSRLGILKAGDRVDFLFSYNLPVDRDAGGLPGVGGDQNVVGITTEGEEQELVTFDLMQSVTIAAVVGGTNEEGNPQPPDALLLTVSPQDALVLKYMKDVGATVDLVLRAPEVEGEFSVDPVDLDYIINGYIVPSEIIP